MQARSIPPLPNQPSKKRKGTKLKWLLFLLFIVILGVLFFRSSISKISDVRFYNSTYVSSTQLETVSGITEGQPYFMISEKQASERLKEEFPYIKEVNLEKQFPGRVNVYIQEYEAVAYELTADGQVMASLENGSEVALEISKKLVLEKPLLTQWTSPDADQLKSELSKKLAMIPGSLQTDISEIRYYPSSSYPDRIKLYTRSGFEVITTIGLLSDRIPYLSGVVETQEPGRITMLEADSYIAYSNLEEEDGLEENELNNELENESEDELENETETEPAE